MSLSDSAIQIAVGGSDDSHVNADRLGPPDPLKFAFLKKPQQFGLKLRGNVADFIEENRAPVRQFDFASFELQGAGKRPLFMTEKLALQEFFRQSDTVDRNKRLVFSIARVMDRSGEYLLACSALAEQQDGGLAGGCLLCHVQRLIDRQALTHDHTMLAIHFFGKDFYFPLKSLALEGFRDDQGYVIRFEGFRYKIIGAFFHSSDCS